MPFLNDFPGRYISLHAYKYDLARQHCTSPNKRRHGPIPITAAQHKTTMQVNILSSPKHSAGLAAQFAYSEAAVDSIRQVLGFTWNKSEKVWESEGPEVLLDMQRFGIGISWISKEARGLAEEFRQQLWDILDAKSEPIHEEEFGYQRQGTRVLMSSRRYLLGDDMGLGKSKQALDAVVELGLRRVLVLCPKTLIYNWQAEVEKWYPDISHEIMSDNRKDRAGFWNSESTIKIANLEKVRLADWAFNVEWDCVIIDEIQRLKTATTETYKKVKQVIKRSNYVWGLTGTPLEIRLPELYNIFQLLRPAVFGNFMRFRDQHLITDWGGTVVGAKNLELLRDRIGYFMLRRTKAEVLRNLPSKVYNNQFIKLTVHEQKEYQELLMEFEKFLVEKEVGGSSDPMVQTIRLRQWCCSPAIWGIEASGSKYQTLLETIDNWDGRVLVFCSFEQMTILLSQWLQNDISDLNKDAYISGAVGSEERIRRVKLFNEGKLGRVFLSTDAGQQGINLTGADMVIHYDQLWNPQKMHQREDRAHRIGQQKIVNVVNLLCMDTIDVGMFQLNREREQLFEEVIEGAEEAMLKKLDAPRLRRIVEGRLNGRV